MACPKCGVEYFIGSMFCPFCKPFGSAKRGINTMDKYTLDDIKVCYSCGTIRNKGFTCCPVCEIKENKEKSSLLQVIVDLESLDNNQPTRFGITREYCMKRLKEIEREIFYDQRNRRS